MFIMKKFFFAIFIGIFAMAMVSPAQADWYFEPGEGTQIEVSAGDEVSVDLWFNNSGEEFTTFAWDVAFQIDISEITPATYANGKFKVDFGMGLGSTYADGGALDDDIYTLAGMNMGGEYTLATGINTKIATLYFDVFDPVQPFDSVADIVLLTQIGTSAKGFLDIDCVTLYQFGGATGPSVGSAVPIPAAVWLLGSGLLGLIGIRRKAA